MIHDVITTPDPFPCTAKFKFVGVRNNKTQQIRRWKINRKRKTCCRISNISNSVWRNDNFLAKARKLSILPTSLDIFDIRHHYVRILYFLVCLFSKYFYAPTSKDPGIWFLPLLFVRFLFIIIFLFFFVCPFVCFS